MKTVLRPLVSAVACICATAVFGDPSSADADPTNTPAGVIQIEIDKQNEPAQVETTNSTPANLSINLAPAPRVLTTNDLPKSEFRGELYDERTAFLRYQAQQAEKGNPEALYIMGMRFLNGIDVPRHESTAREYLEAARKRGSLRARAKLEELNRLARLKQESGSTQAVAAH